MKKEEQVYGSEILEPPTLKPTSMPPINSAQQQQLNHGILENSTTSKSPESSSNTFVVLLTLSIISVTLYFSYNYWKKRQRKRISIAKLEDYRYSRLSQNEIDVDDMQFNNPINDYEEGRSLYDEENGSNHREDTYLNPAPATLQIEATDSVNKEGGSHQLPLIDDLSDEDLLQ